jgi:hypothetical protein
MAARKMEAAKRQRVYWQTDGMWSGTPAFSHDSRHIRTQQAYFGYSGGNPLSPTGS